MNVKDFFSLGTVKQALQVLLRSYGVGAGTSAPAPSISIVFLLSRGEVLTD